MGVASAYAARLSRRPVPSPTQFGIENLRGSVPSTTQHHPSYRHAAGYEFVVLRSCSCVCVFVFVRLCVYVCVLSSFWQFPDHVPELQTLEHMAHLARLGRVFKGAPRVGHRFGGTVLSHCWPLVKCIALWLL